MKVSGLGAWPHCCRCGAFVSTMETCDDPENGYYLYYTYCINYINEYYSCNYLIYYSIISIIPFFGVLQDG